MGHALEYKTKPSRVDAALRIFGNAKNLRCLPAAIVEVVGGQAQTLLAVRIGSRIVTRGVSPYAAAVERRATDHPRP
jgi:hypothetical protein